MLGREENERNPSSGSLPPRKTYWRSVSWSDRSPSNPNPRPSNKSRACLPPLQPLSISKRSVEEWPKAGSDDSGEWPHLPSTPSARPAPGYHKSLDNSDSTRPPLPREFQLKKDKLAFFDKECSRIADHIYLGSEAVAKNREILHSNGITHVLNCVGFVCPEYFKSDLVYKTLWLQDSPSEDITSILYDVFDYFEDVREQGGRVLVHCCQGISRSTSLVIAYLMWRDGQSFENAFQYVKSARGVTNPNMGFACQLLQCQKRVLAVPVSPSSVLRMHRMAPHSPYDPLHLVPKMLSHPGALGLDSRGAFLVHVPSAIYVWIGKNCNQVMAENAKVSASQVIRYERAKGPVVIVEEGKETLDFWDALACGPLLLNDIDKQAKVQEDANSFQVWPLGKDQVEAVINVGVGNKKVVEYDVDFEIFHKALSGGVIPLFPSSGTGSETCLPARENGWGRLRQKFARGFMKELVTSAKLSCDSRNGNVPFTTKDACEDLEACVSSAEPLSSPSPPCGSPDSFSCYLNRSPESLSKSSSPSGCSSAFTFSPASSNWSDSSSLSSQPSPSSSDFRDSFPPKHASQKDRVCLPCEGSFASLAELRGGTSPSLAVMAGDDPPRVSRSISKSWSFSIPSSESDIAKYVGSYKFECKDIPELDARVVTSHSDRLDTENEVIVEGTTDKNEPRSNQMIDKSVDLTHPVLFQWPSIEKFDLRHTRCLDSKSVFLLLSPDVSVHKSDLITLYIWVGRDAQFEEGRNQSIGDQHDYWENVGSDFLNQMGLPVETPMQVVMNGVEPEKFFDDFSNLSIHNADESCKS